MDNIFLSEMSIVNVRHLHGIKIPLSRSEKKHLLLTGKNGSGKTSVLKSLSTFLQYLVSDDFQIDDSKERIAELKDKLLLSDESDRIMVHRRIHAIELNARRRWNDGCVVTVNSPLRMREKYKKGQFVLAYYRDNRQMDIATPTDLSEMDLKQVYEIEERPSQNIGKYLLNLKITQAFAKLKGDLNRDKEIEEWFLNFRQVLRDIYQEQALELEFDIDSHLFTIHIPDRLPFSLDCMSMGYAAIFDIVGDLMMRMDSQHSYNLEGIVMIDEIETHLHVELQRAIVPILTKLFPNIQFVLTTHSPFILNSTRNSVVYDLENNSYIQEGLTDLAYQGIVESYFNVDSLSDEFKLRFLRFKELSAKKSITDEELAELDELQFYLDRIPEYLSLDFAEEYYTLKTEAGL